MASDLYTWRDREPTDEEFAVMRALSDVRVSRGFALDTDVRLDKFLHRDAVEFIAMLGAVFGHALSEALAEACIDPTRGPEQFWNAEPVVRPTPESVEFAALRDLVKALDAVDVRWSRGDGEGFYAVDCALTRARAIVTGSPRQKP